MFITDENKSTYQPIPKEVRNVVELLYMAGRRDAMVWVTEMQTESLHVRREKKLRIHIDKALELASELSRGNATSCVWSGPGNIHSVFSDVYNRGFDCQIMLFIQLVRDMHLSSPEVAIDSHLGVLVESFNHKV